MKPRDIFGLAVRLLGLFFLYLGLKAVTPLLDLGAIETAGKSDLVTAILPIVFNLLVAWWLLSGGWLVRRAYPEGMKNSDCSPSQAERRAPATHSTRSQKSKEIEQAEQLLAPLVKKIKDDHSG